MDWDLALQTVLRGVVAYAAIVAYVRVSGNRTLAKLRAFDFVVTIAIGSVLANVIVDPSVPLWQGVMVLGLLVLLQWIVAKLSVLHRPFFDLVTNAPGCSTMTAGSRPAPCARPESVLTRCTARSGAPATSRWRRCARCTLRSMVS